MREKQTERQMRETRREIDKEWKTQKVRMLNREKETWLERDRYKKRKRESLRDKEKQRETNS